MLGEIIKLLDKLPEKILHKKSTIPKAYAKNKSKVYNESFKSHFSAQETPAEGPTVPQPRWLS